jgi:transketolase
LNLRLADYCGLHLAQRAASMRDVWVLDGDLADSDGAIHFAERHPDRFIMSGIAEQTMISVAAGMASCGLRPWVFSFAAFLCYRACDQIRVCISQARQPVVLVGSHSGGCSGRNGKTHAALNDLALMLSFPNLHVWCPADPEDVTSCVDQVLEDHVPAYIRLPRRVVGSIPGRQGLVRWIAAQGPYLLVSTGLGTHLAVDAQQQLAGRGWSLGLAHVLRLKPFPEDLVPSLESARLIFVLEDHSTFGGLASLVERHTSTRVISLGWPMEWSGESGQDDEILLKGGLDPTTVSHRIETVLRSAA